MRTCALQSGSNGNSVYVEADGTRLLIDAGISGLQAQKRLAEHDIPIHSLDAVLISHDHADHSRSAGIYHRKFGVPVYMTAGTHRVTWRRLGRVRDLREFKAGETLNFKAVQVYTIPTPHDAAESVGFVIEHAGRRLGVLTDLGHPFAGLQELLDSLDAAYLECNYDPDMLEAGPYPPELQARIRGPHGHLSNFEAAELIHRCGRSRPKWIAAAHLSEHNNLPELALDTLRRRLGELYPLHMTSRYGCSAMLEV